MGHSITLFVLSSRRRRRRDRGGQTTGPAVSRGLSRVHGARPVYLPGVGRAVEGQMLRIPRSAYWSLSVLGILLVAGFSGGHVGSAGAPTSAPAAASGGTAPGPGSAAGSLPPMSPSIAPRISGLSSSISFGLPSAAAERTPSAASPSSSSYGIPNIDD